MSTALGELAFSREYLTSYATIIASRPIAERVVEDLQLKISPVALTGQIKSQLLPDTRIIKVTVSDRQPDRAALIANKVVDEFTRQIQSGGKSAVKASSISPAIKPTGAVSPRPFRSGVVGGFLGLLVGMAGALMLSRLDTRLRTEEDVEPLGVPTLAKVPLFKGGEATRTFVMQQDAGSHAAESFRILRTNVQFLAVDRPVQRVLVTSPHAGDGKTTCSANLAASLASAGYRTLLMETDLRRPLIHEYAGMSSTPGVSDVLLGRRTLADAARETPIANLDVLTSGPLPPNPAELLGSQRMVEMLDAASEIYDVVILDTPPVLPVTDATVLAARVDGVILVVRAGKTDRRKAKHAMERFERVGIRVLGIVLNGGTPEESYYYNYNYKYKYKPGQSFEGVPYDTAAIGTSTAPLPPTRKNGPVAVQGGSDPIPSYESASGNGASHIEPSSFPARDRD